ncbi:hypothetical protein [Jiella sp. M17.18]|uniref:hypothetical protein n=1 Tax=Jiella sp. M17.18 TaxID=3234247 RepID=UPI0034DE873A
MAANLVRASRLPVITGLQADLSAIRAAIELARIAGAVVDHRSSQAIYPAIRAIRDCGAFLGAPAEMRRRADRVLLVGREPFAGDPDLAEFLLKSEPDLGVRTRGHGRAVVWLGGEPGATLPGAASVEIVECAEAAIPDVLAMLRAGVAGHRFGPGPLPAETIADLADWLKGAGFGCAVFAATEMDELTAEMLLGLVGDLNGETRFSTLPVFPGGEAYGAALAATWSTGFPLRVSFGRGEPEHDPQIFAAERLVRSGEADLVVDISTLTTTGPALPDWTRGVPLIALGSAEVVAGLPARVAFGVGTAGRDHDGVLFNARFGSFAPVSASGEGSGAPSAAAVLHAVSALLLSAEASAAA